MTIHLSRPDGLLEQDGYAPAALTTLTAGSRLLLLAGQLAVTPAGDTTTTDLAGQIHAALHNVATGVRGAGGEVADIARLTCYVVGWAPDMEEPFWEGVSRAQESDGFGSPMPPLTVVGVQALWRPDLLVEIEATAVLD